MNYQVSIERSVRFACFSVRQVSATSLAFDCGNRRDWTRHVCASLGFIVPLEGTEDI
jgi:hypothetical protein